MRNRNNEFILIIYIARIKMANFERHELEIGLEFGHISFDKRKNFSEGSSSKKYAQVIRVRGRQAVVFLTQITCSYLSNTLKCGVLQYFLAPLVDSWLTLNVITSAKVIL